MNRIIESWSRVTLCTAILAGASCHQIDIQQADKMKDENGNSPETVQHETNAMATELSIDQQVEGARLDLAKRLGIDVNAITIKSARSVNWGSGALGCPKPGMNYTQALVPGLRVLLEVDGVVYYYHGSKGRSLFNCPAKRVRAPAYGQGEEVM